MKTMEHDLTLEHRKLILKYRNLMLDLHRQLLDCGDIYISDVHKLACYELDEVFGFTSPKRKDGSTSWWADAELDPTFNDYLIIKPGAEPQPTQENNNGS